MTIFIRRGANKPKNLVPLFIRVTQRDIDRPRKLDVERTLDCPIARAINRKTIAGARADVGTCAYILKHPIWTGWQDDLPEVAVDFIATFDKTKSPLLSQNGVVRPIEFTIHLPDYLIPERYKHD